MGKSSFAKDFTRVPRLKKREAVAQRCFVKKMFLEILQNLQENTCASLFFNKTWGLQLMNVLCTFNLSPVSTKFSIKISMAAMKLFVQTRSGLIDLKSWLNVNSGSRSQLFFKIGIIKNVMFKGKHLCWSLFLRKFQAWRILRIFKVTYLEEHLRMTASEFGG